MSTYYNFWTSCNKTGVCKKKDLKNLLKKENTVESQTILSIFKGGESCWQTESGVCWITEDGRSWLLG